MRRVARSLILHELSERTRDRWVLVISLLFAVLASAVTLYGRSAGAKAVGLTGPSLVTLASLFVPLVALILSHDAIVGESERNTLGLLLSLPIGRMEMVWAKFIGRGLALSAAVLLGFGSAGIFAGAVSRQVLWPLLLPTLLLGLAFLSLGLLLSALYKRQVSAASAVVVVWFVLVFFYDLGLLGVLVISDGAVSQGVMRALVIANPAGLFRMQMMEVFLGTQALEQLGMTARVPVSGVLAVLWSAWIVGPVLLSGWILLRKKVI